jgi:hypothetical protein
MQITLVITPPAKEIYNNVAHQKFINLITIENGKSRMIPYPPSLRSTPAKIIDPAAGAST